MALFAPYWSPRAGVKTNKDASMAGTCWVQLNSLCRNITGHVQSSQPAKGARHPRRKGLTHRQADCRAWYRDPRHRSEAHDVRSDLHVRQVRWRNLPTGKCRRWHVALLSNFCDCLTFDFTFFVTLANACTGNKGCQSFC